MIKILVRKLKKTEYDIYGKNINNITIYYKNDGHRIKEIYYRFDGTFEYIYEYDENGDIKKAITYYSDGKTIDRITNH